MARRHPNVIKVKKQARMRRAYLKQYFGMIKVGQAIDKSKVPRGAEGIVDYRQRGNTYWDTYLDSKFPSRGMISKERQEAIRKSKLDCVNQLNCLTQEVLPELNVVVRRGGITKTVLRFYFASDYKTCFFMKEDWRNMCIYKSLVYCGQGAKDRAYFDLEHNRISWVDRIDLPQVEVSG